MNESSGPNPLAIGVLRETYAGEKRVSDLVARAAEEPIFGKKCARRDYSRCAARPPLRSGPPPLKRRRTTRRGAG
jgi:hypothetical protein